MNSLIFYGSAQASALAEIARTLPQVAPIFTVAHIEPGHPFGEGDGEAARRCTVLCVEHGSAEFAYPELLPKRHLRVEVPRLETTVLWPLNAVNVFDEPDPPAFPYGHFPYGDAFVSSCIENEVPLQAILPHCLAAEWPGDWPDLDACLAAETARLSALDKACDVKLGSFIVERFTTERLFWAPFAPAKVLLAEVISQILRFCFAQRFSREAVLQHLSALAEPFGGFSVPIHAGIRKHFGMQWYKASAPHAYFGLEHLSEVEYFRRLVEHSYEVKCLRRSTPV